MCDFDFLRLSLQWLHLGWLLGLLLVLLPLVRCQGWGEPRFETGNVENISLAAYNEAQLQQDVWMVEEMDAKKKGWQPVPEFWERSSHVKADVDVKCQCRRALCAWRW